MDWCLKLTSLKFESRNHIKQLGVLKEVLVINLNWDYILLRSRGQINHSTYCCQF